MLPIPFGNLENSRILGTLGDAPTSEQHSGIHYPHTIYVLHIYLRQMAYSVPNTLNILKEIISPASWGLDSFSPFYNKSGRTEGDSLSVIYPEASSCPRWPGTGEETSISMIGVHTLCY
jgi:hypothetical protein